MHPAARTTPWSRALIVRRHAAGESVTLIARAFGVSRQTVYKWVRRYRQGGEQALGDRSPIALHSPSRVSARLERRVASLRRSRRLLGWQIALALSMARSTVIKILKRLGMARLKDLQPPRITQRYAYARPGELVHIDIKKLGRFRHTGHRIHGDRKQRSEGVGYDVLFVAVDDCSRLSKVRRYSREDGVSAADFLRRVILEYQRRKVRVDRVMTDNGKVFTSGVFQDVLKEFGVRHILTPIYTPEWNGKAERFIQTLLREWAYAIAYRNSEERLSTLPAWLRYYNQERQHTSLNYRSPSAAWRAAL